MKLHSDLNISVNDIRDDGAQALAQHPHIVTLDVSGNNIGPQGAIAWAANTTFTTIDIWSEQLLEATIKAFIANTTLKSFFMYLNPTPVDIYGLLLARLEQASSTFKRVQLQKPVDLIDDLSWLILTHIKLNRHEMMLGLCLLTLKENPFPLPCEIIKKHIAPFLIPQRLGEHLFHGLNKRS